MNLRGSSCDISSSVVESLGSPLLPICSISSRGIAGGDEECRRLLWREESLDGVCLGVFVGVGRAWPVKIVALSNAILNVSGFNDRLIGGSMCTQCLCGAFHVLLYTRDLIPSGLVFFFRLRTDFGKLGAISKKDSNDREWARPRGIKFSKKLRSVSQVAGFRHEHG